MVCTNNYPFLGVTLAEEGGGGLAASDLRPGEAHLLIGHIKLGVVDADKYVPQDPKGRAHIQPLEAADAHAVLLQDTEGIVT